MYLKKTALILLSFLVFTSCQEQGNQELVEPAFEKTIRRTTLDESEQLGMLFGDEITNGRISNNEIETEYGTLLFDEIVETITTEEQPYPNFTIRLRPPADVNGTIEYLVLTNNTTVENNYTGYILQFVPDDIMQVKSNVFEGFTGQLSILNLSRETQSSDRFDEGQVVDENSNNGRLLTFEDCECQYIRVYHHTGHSDNNGDFGYFEIIGIHCTCNQDSGGGGLPFQGDVEIGDPFNNGGGDFGDGDSGIGGGGGHGGQGEEIGLMPFMSEEEEELLNLLAVDPFALIDIDCEELSEKWRGLAEHKPNQEVLDRIEDLNEDGYDIEVQYLEDATGAVVNMDYFPVEISQLPENPETGETFTGSEFFEYIRENFADICFNDDTSFGPYNQSESAKWNSNSYLGAVMRFDISVSLFGIFPGQQDGSVICTDEQTQSWIFSTIYTSQDHSHPVSGNREFGLTTNPDGTYTFYTQGVDRVAELFEDLVEELPNTASAFEGGEDIWMALQNNLSNYVNNPLNGGVASVVDPEIKRIDIDSLNAVLNGQKPISDLGCK